MNRNQDRQRQRGSLTLELTVLAPGLLILISVAIAAGRIAIAGGTVEHSARDAARQASLARSPGVAREHARAAAESTLARQQLDCLSLGVQVDTSGFAVPVGQPAQVSATVTCRVDLSGLIAPGLPGSTELTGHFTSPLDVYRERGSP